MLKGFGSNEPSSGLSNDFKSSDRFLSNKNCFIKNIHW